MQSALPSFIDRGASLRSTERYSPAALSSLLLFCAEGRWPKGKLRFAQRLPSLSMSIDTTG
jgi:hypothetical protein